LGMKSKQIIFTAVQTARLLEVDMPTLSRYDEMIKDFYRSNVGEKANPYSYEHELAVQRTLCRVVGEN